MSDERNYGLDLFRVVCCIGVLIYHVFDDVLWTGGGISYLIYFGASYCVPGFFLLSGYLIGTRKELTIIYIETKIVNTIKKLFGWIILWSTIHFIRTGEVYDLVNQMVSGVYSGGILPVSWFLYTYCIILLFAYPLWNINNKHKKLFIVVSVIWMAFLATNFGSGLVAGRTQSLWLHLYLGYFILGMCLSNIFPELNKSIQSRTIVSLAAMVLLFTSLIYAYILKQQATYLAPHNYYGKWFYTLWMLSVFVLCLQWDFNNSHNKKIIKLIASDTMVVYLGHLPILMYITSVHPLESFVEALVCVWFLFILWILIAECMRKMPLLRKIV